ncbi:MAG TPA: type VI secretion system tube protein Hcp [Planctomycetota bacterium]|nr:type VI secretion system tube protein Hcp [Planctomycetota bacterium]
MGATGAGSTKLFMKIAGIKGESSYTKWKDKDCSDIDSFTMSAGATWDFTSGKSTSGSVGFSGVTVSRSLVGASPVLFIGTLKEQKTAKVEVFLGNETGGDPLLTIELSGEVRLTSDGIAGSTGGDVMESITFTAPKVLVKRGDISSDINFQDIAGKNDDLSM